MKKPMDCRNVDEVCELQTDHHDLKGAWILTDGYRVSIHTQEDGKPSTGAVTLTPTQFNRLVAWWQRPQKPRKQSTSGAVKGE